MENYIFKGYRYLLRMRVYRILIWSSYESEKNRRTRNEVGNGSIKRVKTEESNA
jgi:3-phenylpropionate/cinnamic acid dioxygenase small subunit